MKHRCFLSTTALTALGSLALAGAAAAQTGPRVSTTPTTVVDVTGYYLMTDFGGNPAFGAITPITGAGIATDSLSVSERLTDPEGGGIRVSARRLFGSSWFAGGEYTGFFTDERSSIGNAAVDSDRVHANLLDLTLSDSANINGGFDDGIVDFASERVDVEQHFGDLVVGQRFNGGGPLRGFWHTGVRVASTEVDREINYQNLEGAADLDTARIDIDSEMLGVGPTVGGGVTLSLPRGLALSASASASALYADFDLSRRDAYFNLGNSDTEIREVSLDTQEIVPVIDATVEVEKRFGSFFASLGYTMSAWLGGSQALLPNGRDDADDDASIYTVQSENIITHGVTARLGLLLGDAPSNQGQTLLPSGPVGTIVDVTGYYLMTDFGGDPAFGAVSPIAGAGINPNSISVSERLIDPEGGGIRVSARRLFGSSWFAGGEYTGFFTDESSSLGNAGIDTDSVHANLLDGTLSNNAVLNGQFDDGLVDFASERIDVEQHFGDLVVGQRFNGGGPLRGFWHTGVRVASTEVDREINYQNLEGAADLDTARIDIDSEMLGVGPTVGGGVTLSLPRGLALSASASASALYADFDLSRRDTYSNLDAGDTEIREVSLDTQEIVPVFDASLEVEKRFGNFFASLGYTMSAWLGGARSFTARGRDDSSDDATPYTVRSENIITHGVSARVGLLLGEASSDQNASPLLSGPVGTIVDVTGYYLMTDFGGEPAFGAVTPITGAGIDANSFSASERLTDPEGGGIRVSARRLFGSSWFAGGAYTGFFTDESSSIGNAGVDTDSVHANLVDGTLADNAQLNAEFNDGLVDFASESIDVEQHFGDLVVGQRFNGGGPLRGFWHTGVRVASTEVDREINYQNLEGAADLDTARIDIGSEMLGVGPTVGGGVTLSLPHGLALSASASASALYADFDLSRRDAYFNQNAGNTTIREVSLDTQEIMPVFDSSVEVEKHFGKFFASLGYTMSAWLGGARALTPYARDDARDDATPYTVRSENIITHGVTARIGMKFGAAD